MKPQISQSRENIDDNVFEINGINYKKNEDGKSLSVIKGRTEYTGSINVPASVTYKGTSYPVTSIGDCAFCDCSGLISVTIPDSVTSIGWGTFENCSGLTFITIPASVTTIAVSAFKGCSELTSINYNSTNCKKSIGHGLRQRFLWYRREFLDGYRPWFKDCPLTTLNIGGGVKEIPDYLAYNQNSLTSITIPTSVTTIGDSAFTGCACLTSVTIPDSVASIGDRAFEGCSGLTSVIIGSSVTTIGKEAFKGCSGLTSVTIPDSVTSIGDRAFVGCSGLTSVIIGSSVITIGDEAFQDCSGLTSVTIPDSVTSIGDRAFEWCRGLTSVSISASVTSIGKEAFKDCSGLTSVTIPDSVTSIGDGAFEWCRGLTAVTYNAINCRNHVYGSEAWFKGCSLTSFNIGEGVKQIPDYLACGQSRLTSVTIPESVTSIGDSAFCGCSGLTSITIPDSVTSIGGGAFGDCKGLNSVTIGSSVTYIGGGAFYGCTSLAFVTYNATKCGVLGYESFCDPVPWFVDCPLTALNIGEGVKQIPGYFAFGQKGLTSITIPTSVISVGKGAFRDCESLASVTIPASVSFVGEEAFANTPWYNNKPDGMVYIGKVVYKYKGDMLCNTSVVIKDGVVSVSPRAFENCKGLTDVTIPDSVSSIGDRAFCFCSGLTVVTIGNSVTSIGKAAFYGCNGLSSVIIPASVTSIGGRAFEGCSGLTTVTIPDSVTTIGGRAFLGCSGLTAVTYNATNCEGPIENRSPDPWFKDSPLTTLNIGEGVKHIPNYLAYCQRGLISITIPASVTSIGDRAFCDCSSLTSVTFNAINCESPVRNPYSDPFFRGPVSWFKGSPLTTLNIGKGVKQIPDYLACGQRSLTSIAIPASVTSIGGRAFEGCSGLTSVIIPDSVTSIGNKAFEGCTRLTSVTIPSSVTKIGDRALYCEYLREIYSLNPEPPEIGVETFCPFYASGFKRRVYVPEGSISKYKQARYWERFESFHAIVVPHDDGVTDGGDDLK